MPRRTLAVGSLLAAGAFAACAPELRAYRRLAAITRSMRGGPASGPPRTTDAELR